MQNLNTITPDNKPMIYAMSVHFLGKLDANIYSEKETLPKY